MHAVRHVRHSRGVEKAQVVYAPCTLSHGRSSSISNDSRVYEHVVHFLDFASS